MLPNIYSIWKDFFNIKVNVYNFFISISLLILTLFALTSFLTFVESRNGAILIDPILKSFNPINLNWLIFLLIYLSVVIGILSLLPQPENLLLLVQSYILMILIRIMAMFVIPLNPPENTILLNDPFVQYFTTGQILTKDLFFSGHTATIFLIYLVSTNKSLKNLFLIFTILIACALLIQHVHYSIDILAAPFFSYGSYRIVKILHYVFLVKKSQNKEPINNLDIN